MKRLFTVLWVIFLLFFITPINNKTNAQIWKRIKGEAQSHLENNVVNKAGNATDKAVDKAVEAITGSTHKNLGGNKISAISDISNAAPPDYKNYDFVPGDTIIFEPDFSREADAELPSRFTIKAGTAEMQSYKGEKVLHLQPDAKTAVEPLMNTDHYLPEQFTLEFDMMYENEDSYFRYASDFRVGFLKRGDNNFYNGGIYSFVIHNTSQCSFGKTGTQNFPEPLTKSIGNGSSWHHIAIYVRNNIGKVYVDQYRVCATNALPLGADKFYIKADRYGIKIKNVRLAEGGDDKYNKIITVRKFITHGILFHTNRATIRPESMGTLNEIAMLMKSHNDLKFEIDGYTDSDGTGDANLTLSRQRADAVKTGLTSLGINPERLTTNGFGESKPIDKNDTAEGKANNRRVEFLQK